MAAAAKKTAETEETPEVVTAGAAEAGSANYADADAVNKIDFSPEPQAPVLKVNAEVGAPQTSYQDEMKVLADKRLEGEPEGRILDLDAPLKFEAEEVNGEVIAKEDVYRRVLPRNSNRYTYKLLVAKGSRVPAGITRETS